MNPSRSADRIAVATCQALPDGDEEAVVLRAALASSRIAADWVVWGDGRV